MLDTRRYAPATERNREPILALLRQTLPAQGLVLEIASGTGQHSTYFAPHFPQLTWQPSDPTSEALTSIASWQAHEPSPNLLPPVYLDASAPIWPVAHCVAILCINMIHIAPWAATQGLMAGAQRVLAPGGLLYLYGPYKQAGQHTAPSNAQFDEALRAQDPAWGVRDLEAVVALAQTHGFTLGEKTAMPTNNLSVILRKS